MAFYHHHLFLILLLLLLPPTFSNPAADRSALLRLRDAVRGRTLRWNSSSATPCSWRGVRCDHTTYRVIELRLPGSGLLGHVPLNSIGNLTELQALSLRGNSLSGQLPSDLASCTQLRELHLQGNIFLGEIPDSFFTLRDLVRVNLARNNFSGNLSSKFNSLIKLRTLYLEYNHLTGSLPDLRSLVQLRNFNVSFNILTGSIPSSLGSVFASQSFRGTSLCGRPLGSCPSSKGDKLSSGAIAGIAVGSVLIVILLILLVFSLWRKYRSRKIRPRRSSMAPSPVRPPKHEIVTPNPVDAAEKDQRPNSHLPIDIWNPKERQRMANMNGGGDGLFFFGEDVEAFCLKELLSSPAEVIGTGTVGSTFKVYFKSGVEVVVKRLQNVCLTDVEFRDKIEEVGSLIHENLEPLGGYFCGRDEKLLLYGAMPNGSLSALLHGNNKRPVSWEMRANIALGAARGVEYLHSISPGTTHGNIKSSNIFLTDYYNACVSEFGLTQLVSSKSNFGGYRAPEVTDPGKISQQADVYGFGVLILELLTSKAPDSKEGIELPSWVRSVAPEKWRSDVLDPDILRCEFLENKMVQFLRLALSCTDEVPPRRPSMVEVARRIEEICGFRLQKLKWSSTMPEAN